jgi:hypothetical protein
VLLAGCGGDGGPHMARNDAAPLITLADKITHEGPCAQARDIRRLSALRTTLVQAHKIPAALQEPLSSGVNALVAQTPVCLPPVPAATVTPPVVTIIPAQGKKHEHGHHGNGKGKGEGKD